MFFITDCLFAIAMLVVWELPWYLALAFFLFFGTLDGVYLSATLNKVCCWRFVGGCLSLLSNPVPLHLSVLMQPENWS